MTGADLGVYSMYESSRNRFVYIIWYLELDDRYYQL